MNITSYHHRQAAINYAKADRSDPFALRRALTHMNNGVASYRAIAGEGLPAGSSGFYEATAVPGDNGKISYTNLRRP